MTPERIAELREWGTRESIGPYFGIDSDDVDEMLDEIERLRAELVAAHRYVDYAFGANCQCGKYVASREHHARHVQHILDGPTP